MKCIEMKKKKKLTWTRINLLILKKLILSNPSYMNFTPTFLLDMLMIVFYL